MGKTLYRYRPLEVIKGKKTVVEEIKNREIYLATISENNDPMDGMIPFLWDGDEVIWENFFKNYCKNLLGAYYNTIVAGDDGNYNDEIIIVDSNLVLNMENLPLNDTFQIFYKAARQDKVISKVIEYLVEITIVEEETLIFLFNSIHPFIIKYLKETLRKNGDNLSKYLKVSSLDKGLILESLKILKNGKELTEKQKNIIFNIYNDNFRNTKFLLEYRISKNGSQIQYKKNFLCLNLFFSIEFIKKFKENLYGEYYLACFSEKNDNQLMWSHYADSHKGICLVYEFESDENGLKIELDEGNHYIKPIKYGEYSDKISIFKNIGKLPYPILDKEWLNFNGKSSKLCSYYFSKEFHSNYWDIINEKTIFKFKDWEYENEYRMVDYPMFGEQLTREERLKNYNINQLKGIIFGVRTPIKTKFEIIEMLDKELKGEQRENFEFYQARQGIYREKLQIDKISSLKLS